MAMLSQGVQHLREGSQLLLSVRRGEQLSAVGTARLQLPGTSEACDRQGVTDSWSMRQINTSGVSFFYRATTGISHVGYLLKIKLWHSVKTCISPAL